MEDNGIAVILGVDGQRPKTASRTIWGAAESIGTELPRCPGGDLGDFDVKLRKVDDPVDDFPGHGKPVNPVAQSALVTQTDRELKAEYPRTRELVLCNPDSSRGVADHSHGVPRSPSAEAVTVKTRDSTPLSKPADIQPIPSVISRARKQVTSRLSTTFTNALTSASTPHIPTSNSSATITTTISSTPTTSGFSPPPLPRSRTSASTSTSASALSFFRGLKSALKGKGRAQDKDQAKQKLPSIPDFPDPTISKSAISLPTLHYPTPPLTRRTSTSHLSSLFHGLRRGHGHHKLSRSTTTHPPGMPLPPPIIECHPPTLSPPLIPSPINSITAPQKRKRDIFRRRPSFKPVPSSSYRTPTSLSSVTEGEDPSLHLGHIPLPSPLTYETCAILPPNPSPKYTVTIFLAHPGQKVEYEMDNTTGRLLILVYTPHGGFNTIEGVIGNGSPPDPHSYNYDPDGYRPGGIWVPQAFDWNGLRVADWGSVSGKVIFQFPPFHRVGVGEGNMVGAEFGEREIMPPGDGWGEDIVEVRLDEGDMESCIIREGRWDDKGKGKAAAAAAAGVGGAMSAGVGRIGSGRKGKLGKLRDRESGKEGVAPGIGGVEVGKGAGGGGRYDLRRRPSREI